LTSPEPGGLIGGGDIFYLGVLLLRVYSYMKSGHVVLCEVATAYSTRARIFSVMTCLRHA